MPPANFSPTLDHPTNTRKAQSNVTTFDDARLPNAITERLYELAVGRIGEIENGDGNDIPTLWMHLRILRSIGRSRESPVSAAKPYGRPAMVDVRHARRGVRCYHFTPRSKQTCKGPAYAPRLSENRDLMYSGSGPGSNSDASKLWSSSDRCKVRRRYGLASGCWSRSGCTLPTQSWVSVTNFGVAASRAGVPASPSLG
jgi:hypothetical protein